MEYTSTVRIESQICPGVAFTLHKPSYGRVLEFDRKNAKFFEESRKLSNDAEEAKETLRESRKAWFDGQVARLAELKKQPADDPETQASIARIETGLEYERLLELVERCETEEQRLQLGDKFAALPVDKDVFVMDPELVAAFRDLRERSNDLTASEYNLPRLKWGLSAIEGMTINGKPATADSLAQDGPIDLVREIVRNIDVIAKMTTEQLTNFELPSSSDEAAGKAESTTTANAA